MLKQGLDPLVGLSNIIFGIMDEPSTAKHAYDFIKSALGTKFLHSALVINALNARLFIDRSGRVNPESEAHLTRRRYLEEARKPVLRCLEQIKKEQPVMYETLSAKVALMSGFREDRVPAGGFTFNLDKSDLSKFLRKK
jgi:hypothetical protein